MPGDGSRFDNLSFVFPTRFPLDEDQPFDAVPQAQSGWARLWWDQEAAHFLDYLFANAGTDFAPIIEAYAKAQAHGTRVPKPRTSRFMGPRFTVSTQTVDRSTPGAAGFSRDKPTVIAGIAAKIMTARTIRRMSFLRPASLRGISMIVSG